MRGGEGPDHDGEAAEDWRGGERQQRVKGASSSTAWLDKFGLEGEEEAQSAESWLLHVSD